MEASNFKRLIGVWKTEGIVKTENGVVKLMGTDSYEFVLNSNYILHKADVKIGDEKSETLEIIIGDNSVEKAIMKYFNSKAESGTMTSSLTENDFKINGDKIKFEGSIDDQNKTIKGKWYLLADNSRWNDFIDLTLTKQN